MTKLELYAKEFKRMADPVEPNSPHMRYVCYVRASSIPPEIDNWMETNPRDQKMKTAVATKIISSLADNSDFHELNRGIVFSAQDVKWDNKTGALTLLLDDVDLHGNIDGGHTLRAILDAQLDNTLSDDRYVFFEIFTGLTSPVELAAARNTSVQVDQKSIQELENSFEGLKVVLNGLGFSKRVQYKMNEHYNDDDIEPIDVREVIAIILMFSQEIYGIKTSRGTLSDIQPIQCYTGKEASLRKFITMGTSDTVLQKSRRAQMLRNMQPICKDIFDLWETIECNFASGAGGAGKRYGTRKYSRFNNNEEVGKSYFAQKSLQYIVPKGIMYPIVGAFRALVEINSDGSYRWRKNPLDVWAALGSTLVSIILDEKADNPDSLAKNSNVWSNLFKEVYIYGYLSNNA